MFFHFENKNISILLIASAISLNCLAFGQSSSTPLQGSATKKAKPTSTLSSQQATIDQTHASSKTVKHAHVQHTHTATANRPKSFFAKHPMVKDATIGAGVGAAGGGVTGLISHRGIMHGALIGAGTGAGVGAIHASKTMRRHPYMQDAAEGGLGGLGLGLAASRSHGKAAAAAGIGAAAGLGYRFFENKTR
jgi:hypothetical protein